LARIQLRKTNAKTPSWSENNNNWGRAGSRNV
jgi:hypothetical protein